MFCMHENFFPHVELASALGRGEGGLNNLLIVWLGIVIHSDLHVNFVMLNHLIILRSARFTAEV